MKKRVDISVIIMVLVIVAVAVLGGFAVAPTVKNMAATREATKLSERMMNGTATVADLANSAGLKADEYIAKYASKDSKITADTNMTEFMEKITLKNYCEVAGIEFSEETLEAYKAANEDAKDVTADSTEMEAKSGYVAYVQEQQAAAQAEQAEIQEQAEPSADVETEAETDAEAETETETEAEATEAPSDAE